MVKYVTPMFTYLLISLKMVSGVPTITNSDFSIKSNIEQNNVVLREIIQPR